jgi:hypothetical protein
MVPSVRQARLALETPERRLVMVGTVALAAGGTMWVLVGSLDGVGSRMVRTGGIRGAGVLVLLLGSWRILWDGGPYSGESPARRCQCH